METGIAELNRGTAAIQGDAKNEGAALARRNSEQTAAIEAAANEKSLSAEKQKTAAIQAEYDARLRKYQEELQQQEISQDDYNRRVAAAAEERDAEMVGAAKEAHDKMAREFSGFFQGMDHPLQELARLGDKAAGNAAATLVQRYQGGHSLSGKGSGSLFGGIFSGFKKHNPDAVAEIAGAHGSSATNSIFSVGTAQIHVGSASIAFGGGSSTATGSMISGASSSSIPAATAAFSYNGASGTTSSGIVGGVSSAMKNARSGVDLLQSARSNFGGAGMKTQTSSLDNLLNPDGSIGSGKASGLGGFVNAHGAQMVTGASSALGLFSAYEGNGGAGGAMKGAMSGMELGGMIAGPLGAGIGAAGGAVLGAIGFGGREKARVYDLKQVRPRITADTDSYEQGGMDYLSAYSDMQSLMNEAKQTTHKMGPAANSYYQDTIKKEIETAEQKFTSMQKAGRSMYTASAASYAVGTDAVPETGMALVHKDERIIPSDQNQQITRALTYRAAMQSSGARGGAQSSRTMNMNVHAIDSKGVAEFFDKYKHHLRAALNDSYAENSGGSAVA